jgi:hypothetical protein
MMIYSPVIFHKLNLSYFLLYLTLYWTIKVHTTFVLPSILNAELSNVVFGFTESSFSKFHDFSQSFEVNFFCPVLTAQLHGRQGHGVSWR